MHAAIYDEVGVSADLPIDKELAMALGVDTPKVGSKCGKTRAQFYEEAVLNVYDKASTSEDWLRVKTIKGCAGSKWLDVCATASERLDAGDTFEQAFHHATQFWEVAPPQAPGGVVK